MRKTSLIKFAKALLQDLEIYIYIYSPRSSATTYAT